MFVEETEWIKNSLQSALPDCSSVLDIGSSNLKFRTEIQPHITANLYQPLVDRGCRVTHADIKEDEGVDLVIDFSRTDLPDSLFGQQYDLVICCNILEHVADRDVFMTNLSRFTRQGGLLLITVPHLYPRHNDPIDTMYRPNSAELREFVDRFGRITPLKEEILAITGKQYYSRKPGRILDYITLRPYWNLWRYYYRSCRWKVACLLAEIRPAS